MGPSSYREMLFNIIVPSTDDLLVFVLVMPEVDRNLTDPRIAEYRNVAVGIGSIPRIPNEILMVGDFHCYLGPKRSAYKVTIYTLSGTAGVNSLSSRGASVKDVVRNKSFAVRKDVPVSTSLGAAGTARPHVCQRQARGCRLLAQNVRNGCLLSCPQLRANRTRYTHDEFFAF